MGVLADRTNTRWGKFRPWILWTALPWAVVMVLAYTTPKGWSMGAMIAYAAITNTLLMTLYSMNNMPYSALGGVMTGDVNERAKLNSYRFIAVNIAQFIVGGFTLPLVAKFAAGHDRAVRLADDDDHLGRAVPGPVPHHVPHHPGAHPTGHRSRSRSPKQDFADLLKNSPWIVMFVMTLVHFAILSFRGGALYNYYHHYADKAAMYDFVEKLGLTAPALALAHPRPAASSKRSATSSTAPAPTWPNSNVADVFNSIINMIGTATTIIVILLSAVASPSDSARRPSPSRASAWRHSTPSPSICSRRRMSTA